mgnify:CR=1 FL=1
MMYFLVLSIVQAEPSVVFIGNSYTQFNSLPNHVQAMSQELTGWSAIETVSLTGGGLTLSDHASRMTDEGSTWQETFAEAHDWFVFQDQSQIPGFPQSESYWQDSLAGLQEMHSQVNAVEGLSMLMLTWGRRDGDPQNPALYQDFTAMQERLNEGYLAYATQAGTVDNPIYIAPVGPVFAYVHEADSVLFSRLYGGDGSHPSQLGTTVASLAMMASLTGRSVREADHGLEDVDAPLLIEAVENVVLEMAVEDYPLPWVWTMIPEDGQVVHETMRPLLRIQSDQSVDLDIVDGRVWLESGRLEGRVSVSPNSEFRIAGGVHTGSIEGSVSVDSGQLRLTEVTGNVVQTGGEVWLDQFETEIVGEATLTLLQLHPDLEEASLQTGGMNVDNLELGEGLSWAEGLNNSIYLVRVPNEADTAEPEPSTEPSTEPENESDEDDEDDAISIEKETGCANVGLLMLLPLWMVMRQRKTSVLQ